MAEEIKELTAEELQQIRDLMEVLSSTGPEAFSPMASQFQSDMLELKGTLDGETPEEAGGAMPEAFASPEETPAEEASPFMDSFGMGEEEKPAEETPFEALAPAESFSPETSVEDTLPTDDFSADTLSTPDSFSFDETPLPTSGGDDFADFGAPLESAPAAEGGDFSFDEIPSTPAGEMDTQMPEMESDIGGFDLAPAAETSAESSDFDFSAAPEADAFGTPGDFDSTPSFDTTDTTPSADFSFDETPPSTDDSDLSGFDMGAAPAMTETSVAASPMEETTDFGTPDMDFGSMDIQKDDIEFDDLAGGGMDTDFGSSDLQPAAESTAPDFGDLSDMTQQSQMSQGIGDEFTDEDLAKIRTQINDYPPGLKKAIIDTTVNEKISRPDQRLLMNMIVDQANPEAIADFLDARLGYRPDTSPPRVRKDGVQILYADQLSPEDMAKRRRRTKFVLFGAAGAVAGVAILFASLTLLRNFSIKGEYEKGLEELRRAASAGVQDKQGLKKSAETHFQNALRNSNYNYSVEYLNKYGIAYMKAGFYEDAFVKLYGQVNPDYTGESAWNVEGQRAPLIRTGEHSRWPSSSDFASGKTALVITARDEIERSVLIPGAYIVSRVRDQQYEKQTLLNLGRFHSNTARSFIEGSGKIYKNDDLAIDYYRLILTLGDKPDDIDALSGIGQIYYNRKEFASAAREYNKIIDKFPKKVQGHAGLLNTYIEIWKQNNDPRMVIATHRHIRSLGLEEDLPMYLLAKLAGFYIDLDQDDLRIKYQVDPVDAVSGIDIKDFSVHLLGLVFNKSEDRDGQEIEGAHYGEGFYQRGRYLLAQRETVRALRQFQNAHHYDPRHYLAINAMGEYYRSIRDFARATEYFTEADRTYQEYHRDYGLQPEDETLIAGDHAKILFNLGSLDYLHFAGVGMTDKDTEAFPDTRIYPDRNRGQENEEMTQRRERLQHVRADLEKALSQDLKDKWAKIDGTYWMGWIDYINGDFEGSLEQWETLDTIYSYSDPVLLLARANAYYYTDQHRAALGNYLKLETDYERRAMQTAHPDLNDPKHRDLYLTLAAIYNNIGAVYEKEYIELSQRGGSRIARQELEKNSLMYYWKAIQAAQKIGEESVRARTNVQQAFKYIRPESGPGRSSREPLLDDWVPPLLSQDLRNRSSAE